MADTLHFPPRRLSPGASVPHRLQGQAQAEYQAEAILKLRRLHQPQDEKRWPGASRDDVDQGLRLACEWDLGLFGKTFVPHICALPYNAVHTDYYALYRQRQGSRGHRDVVAAPRGSSKTTGCALLRTLHAACYRTEWFILYITNRAENAEEKVKQVRDECDDNALLQRVYGPLRSALWNQGHWRTPWAAWDGPACTTVLAAGRGSQLRGATQRFQRPTLILPDDVEHPEQVLSELQRAHTRDWFFNDIVKLGTPRTNVEVSGTVLHPLSLLQDLLGPDNTGTPGWHGRLYRAVETFADATATPLWQQWRTLFLDKRQADHQERARAFYDAHRLAMTRNVRVLWEAQQDYYALMVERLVDGESAFWQEKQNQPLGDTRYLFAMDGAAYCRLTPQGIVAPHGFVPWLDVTDVAAFYDPALGRGGDCACCAIVAVDTAGYEYVLEAYCTNTDSPDDQATAIVDLLWRWQVPVLGVEANGFQSLLPKNLRAAIAQHARAVSQPWDVGLIPITHVRAKTLRIKTLEPPVSNGWLIFSATLPGECLRQMTDYLPAATGGRDDFPDALEGAIATLRGKYRKQDWI